MANLVRLNKLNICLRVWTINSSKDLNNLAIAVEWLETRTDFKIFHQAFKRKRNFHHQLFKRTTREFLIKRRLKTKTWKKWKALQMILKDMTKTKLLKVVWSVSTSRTLYPNQSHQRALSLSKETWRMILSIKTRRRTLSWFYRSWKVADQAISSRRGQTTTEAILQARILISLKDTSEWIASRIATTSNRWSMRVMNSLLRIMRSCSRDPKVKKSFKTLAVTVSIFKSLMKCKTNSSFKILSDLIWETR